MFSHKLCTLPFYVLKIYNTCNYIYNDTFWFHLITFIWTNWCISWVFTWLILSLLSPCMIYLWINSIHIRILILSLVNILMFHKTPYKSKISLQLANDAIYLGHLNFLDQWERSCHPFSFLTPRITWPIRALILVKKGGNWVAIPICAFLLYERSWYARFTCINIHGNASLIFPQTTHTSCGVFITKWHKVCA